MVKFGMAGVITVLPFKLNEEELTRLLVVVRVNSWAVVFVVSSCDSEFFIAGFFVCDWVTVICFLFDLAG